MGPAHGGDIRTGTYTRRKNTHRKDIHMAPRIHVRYILKKGSKGCVQSIANSKA